MWERRLTNASLLMDGSRHDTNLAFLRLDDAWAIGSDQSSLGLLLQVPLDLCR